MTDEERRAVIEECAKVAEAWGPFVINKAKNGLCELSEAEINDAASKVIARKIRQL